MLNVSKKVQLGTTCTLYLQDKDCAHVLYHHSHSRLQFSIGRHQKTADVDRSTTDLQSLQHHWKEYFAGRQNNRNFRPPVKSDGRLVDCTKDKLERVRIMIRVKVRVRVLSTWTSAF